MGPGRAVRRAAMAVLLALSADAPGRAAGAAGDPDERLIEGELVRVDVAKRTLAVRPTAGPPREFDVAVGGETAITGSGRSLALEELKTGEPIAVVCAGEARGSCRARRVRAGAARHAVPPAAAR